LEIIERGYPVVIALNMWDDTMVKNIDVDVEKLKAILKIPIVPTVAITGEGLKELVSRIGDASSAKIEDIMGRVS
jgi:ferrous iron transport protein B